MRIYLFFYLLILLCNCSVYKQDLKISACNDDNHFNTPFSKAKDIQIALEELVRTGVPGCSMTVYTDEGWWSASAGYAKIETKTPMQSCHLQYLQSVAKTYMSVAILKLHEQNKIDLNAPITNYLASKYSTCITNAEKITVRMLLNHTSGIPEYNSVPAYITKLLQHPDFSFTPEDYLKYVKGKPLDFLPGSKYAYRNTNYLILALIADAITGDHAKFITETILSPLMLNNTYYRNDADYLNYPALVNTYWDRHSNSIIENVSQLQRNNVASLIGDDGIVATPTDAVKFLKALMEEKLLSAASLQEMKTWVKDSKGNFTYGLGLDYATFRNQIAYGHSGGGIGAGCQLYYFPQRNIYMFIGINLGTVTDSPLHEASAKALDKIYAILLE